MRFGDTVSKLKKCDCGKGSFDRLSGGGGAEIWRCGYCGVVYNVNPFNVEKMMLWSEYACKDMFEPPINELKART